MKNKMLFFKFSSLFFFFYQDEKAALKENKKKREKGSAEKEEGEESGMAEGGKGGVTDSLKEDEYEHDTSDEEVRNEGRKERRGCSGG